MCPTVACSEQVQGFIGLMYSVYTITLSSPSICEPICSGPGTFYAKSMFWLGVQLPFPPLLYASHYRI